MKNFREMSASELKELYSGLKNKYESYVSMGLSLDLSRGKPNSDQLDVSQALLTSPLTRSECFDGKLDCRNYGVLDGLPAMKRLFSKMLDIPENYISIGGNSSLQLMYDAIARAMLFGVLGSERPWCQEQGLKWICITPGYDRHFRITQTFGFELLSVPMTENGPDMDMVEELVKDPKVKGIWCVPKYSNPTGNTYSDETVRRLVSMECAAPDFRIMWDNAYAVHDLYEEGDKLLNVFDEAEKYGTADRIFCFASTSKITFPGAGVALLAATPANLKQINPYLGAQTIGYDKLNQLRHINFFADESSVHSHMMEMAKTLRSKFEITLNALSTLEGAGICKWTKPRGGYFVSLDVEVGSAKTVFELMKGAGVTLTDVGATFPYGTDPKDSNLRLAPTYPSDSDLALAMEILVCVLQLTALKTLLGD